MEEAKANAETNPEVAAVRRGRWKIWLAVAGVVLALVGIQGWLLWSEWNKVGVLRPSGGLYFLKEVALAVPSFRQNDPRWGNDLLGPTEGTLGAEGCAVSSAAMVLGYYGVDTDPQRLNAFLQKNNGYTPEGWIYWEAAAEFEPGRAKHVYEDKGSYWLLDRNLLAGNPVIVKLRLASGTNHFVVVAGKRGQDYLIQDPGSRAGLYPLKEIGSNIEGLRFYEKLRN